MFYNSILVLLPVVGLYVHGILNVRHSPHYELLIQYSHLLYINSLYHLM